MDPQNGEGEIASVAVTALQPGDSPRLAGLDLAHAAALAEGEPDLPPIIVHHPTMRVIDGMHRLRAAVLRGDTEIAVRYFTGSEDAAFVLAVHANTTHGLPLRLADRLAAAARIIRSHPHWSDRAIGGATGLAAQTVNAVRRRSGDSAVQGISRLGLDGRVRPLNSVEGRLKAHAVIREHPEASLRQIAKASGISLGTARDVKERVRHGMDPLPAKHQVDLRDRGKRATSAQQMPAPDCAEVLQNLRRDPSLRFTDRGRSLLRVLDLAVSALRDSRQAIEGIPPHCSYLVIELARGASAEWLELARTLQERASSTEEVVS